MVRRDHGFISAHTRACRGRQTPSSPGYTLANGWRSSRAAAWICAPCFASRRGGGRAGAERPALRHRDHPGSRQEPEELMRLLLAHTSLECNVSLNLTLIGRDVLQHDENAADRSS